MPGEHDQPDAESRLIGALHELSASAGRTLHPDELVKLVALRACELVKGDAVALYLWDESIGALTPLYTNDPRAQLPNEPLQLGQGAAGQAMLCRQAIIVEDYEHYEHAVDWA